MEKTIKNNESVNNVEKKYGFASVKELVAAVFFQKGYNLDIDLEEELEGVDFLAPGFSISKYIDNITETYSDYVWDVIDEWADVDVCAWPDDECHIVDDDITLSSEEEEEIIKEFKSVWSNSLYGDFDALKKKYINMAYDIAHDWSLEKDSDLYSDCDLETYARTTDLYHSAIYDSFLRIVKKMYELYEEEESVSPAMYRLACDKEVSVIVTNALNYAIENADCYGADLPGYVEDLFADIKAVVDERYGIPQGDSWLSVLDMHEGSGFDIKVLCDRLLRASFKVRGIEAEPFDD